MVFHICSSLLNNNSSHNNKLLAQLQAMVHSPFLQISPIRLYHYMICNVDALIGYSQLLSCLCLNQCRHCEWVIKRYVTTIQFNSYRTLPFRHTRCTSCHSTHWLGSCYNLAIKVLQMSSVPHHSTRPF